MVTMLRLVLSYNSYKVTIPMDKLFLISVVISTSFKNTLPKYEPVT